MFDKEYIICSAIWYKNEQHPHLNPVNITEGLVICGHRHGHCIYTYKALTGKRTVLTSCGPYIQGFLTSKNRFVDRKEGAIIALEAGQIEKKLKTLYSENIY